MACLTTTPAGVHCITCCLVATCNLLLVCVAHNQQQGSTPTVLACFVGALPVVKLLLLLLPHVVWSVAPATDCLLRGVLCNRA
jgi:hypothetical protein